MESAKSIVVIDDVMYKEKQKFRDWFEVGHRKWHFNNSKNKHKIYNMKKVAHNKEGNILKNTHNGMCGRKYIYICIYICTINIFL